MYTIQYIFMYNNSLTIFIRWVLPFVLFHTYKRVLDIIFLHIPLPLRHPQSGITARDPISSHPVSSHLSVFRDCHSSPICPWLFTDLCWAWGTSTGAGSWISIEHHKGGQCPRRELASWVFQSPGVVDEQKQLLPALLTVLYYTGGARATPVDLTVQS